MGDEENRLPPIAVASSHVEMAGPPDLPPPGYETAVNAPTADNPPSYESLTLVNKLRQAKEKSSNPVEYFTSACAIICGSFVFTIFFAISIAMPITMIVIGAIYKDQCTIERYIPIWLIVAGVFGCISSIVRTASNCYTLFTKRGDAADAEGANNKIQTKGCLTSLIELFLFAWFIAGNVWVYSVRNSVQYTNPVEGSYCHQTVYLFSFWLITLSWILSVLFCCCCCCVLVVIGCGLGIAGASQ